MNNHTCDKTCEYFAFHIIEPSTYDSLIYLIESIPDEHLQLLHIIWKLLFGNDIQICDTMHLRKNPYYVNGRCVKQINYLHIEYINPHSENLHMIASNPDCFNIYIPNNIKNYADIVNQINQFTDEELCIVKYLCDMLQEYLNMKSYVRISLRNPIDVYLF